MKKRQFLVAVALLLMASTAIAWTLTREYDLTTGDVPGSPGDACRNIPGLAELATDPKDSGNQVCRLFIEEGTVGWQTGWGGTHPHPAPITSGDELWIRIRTLLPATFDFNNMKLKFLRTNALPLSVKNDLQYNASLTDPPNSLAYIFEGEAKWEYFGDLPTRDVWETYEWYMKFDDVSQDGGGEALVQVWKDGIRVGKLTNRYTLSNDTDTVDKTYVYTWWNGGAPSDQHVWIDDLHITNETPSQTDDYGFPIIGLVGVGEEEISTGVLLISE